MLREKKDNSENLKKWQRGLVSYEHLEGEERTPGAKAKLTYEQRGKRFEMIETIIKFDLPEEFKASYTVKGTESIILNKFIDEGPNLTKLHTDTEFRLRGIMKLFGPLMKGAFKKQTRKDLENFKKFVESSPD